MVLVLRGLQPELRDGSVHLRLRAHLDHDDDGIDH